LKHWDYLENQVRLVCLATLGPLDRPGLALEDLVEADLGEVTAALVRVVQVWEQAAVELPLKLRVGVLLVSLNYQLQLLSLLRRVREV
jgi:hypothetical protein